MTYPNPTNGKVLIQIEPSLHTEINLNVYDALGRLVLSEHVLSGASKIPINLERFSRGVYMVEVSADDHIIATKRIITF